jgi:hypothetical protein
MALKLLNPGLRPLGLFDLNDDDTGNLVGGEYVELQQDNVAVEAYAADVGQLADNTGMINFTRKICVTENLGGLADEGTDEYGTLFGSLIGSNTGRATQAGTVAGAVVIGPSTDRASGKVTVWAQAGLYGVTDQNVELDSADANDPLGATAAGLLLTTLGMSDPLGCYVGAMTDTSLVSTTNAAAGITPSVTEYHAVFFAGTSAIAA